MNFESLQAIAFVFRSAICLYGTSGVFLKFTNHHRRPLGEAEQLQKPTPVRSEPWSAHRRIAFFCFNRNNRPVEVAGLSRDHHVAVFSDS